MFDKSTLFLSQMRPLGSNDLSGAGFHGPQNFEPSCKICCFAAEMSRA